MNPFTVIKNISPFHYTFLFFSFLFFSFLFFFFIYPINPSFHFTLLFTSTTRFTFTSLPFTFYFLSPSFPPLFYTFLTLVLKIWVLPWEWVLPLRKKHICVIQGVSRLVNITAEGDFLGLCDQKGSQKHVSDFGRLQSYGHFLIPVHAIVWTAS